eukprot:6297816-Prymnesium_polylepis.1
MAYVYHGCALYHVGVVVIRVTRVLVHALMKALVLIEPNDEAAHAPRALRRRGAQSVFVWAICRKTRLRKRESWVDPILRGLNPA